MEHCAGEAGERVKDITSPMEQLPVLRVDMTERKWWGGRESSEGVSPWAFLVSFRVPL